MTHPPKVGKIFMNDKDRLLQLADNIASGKERETKRKIDKTKASASLPSKKKHGGHPKSAFPSASDKLYAAKELVAARKARHKREKARARKAEGQATQTCPGPAGDGSSADKLPSSSTTAKRKRVLFA